MNLKTMKSHLPSAQEYASRGLAGALLQSLGPSGCDSSMSQGRRSVVGRRAQAALAVCGAASARGFRTAAARASGTLGPVTPSGDLSGGPSREREPAGALKWKARDSIYMRAERMETPMPAARTVSMPPPKLVLRRLAFLRLDMRRRMPGLRPMV